MNRIYNWADEEGEQYVFCLSSLAGTGKTTVARSVARWYYTKQRLGASFFFSRGGGDVGRAGRFVTSIAVQLARSVSSVRRHVNNALVQRPEIVSQSLRDQRQYLVLESLLKLESPSIFVLVIDDLDECEGSNDTQLIVQLLAMSGSLQNVRLRVFLTSRPEVPIQYGLGQVPDVERRDFLLHKMSPTIIDHDIQLFLEYQLGMIGKEDFKNSAGWAQKSSKAWFEAQVGCSFGLQQRAASLTKASTQTTGCTCLPTAAIVTSQLVLNNTSINCT